MSRSWRYGVAAVAAAGALLVACGGSSDSTSTPESAAESTTAAATTAAGGESTAAAIATVQDATTSGTFATNTAEAGATQVSANNASRNELAAAFDTAGISNADRWAKEVEEYRPYPEDDANMAKLRDELAKYNPSEGVVDAIVATLSLP